MQSYIVITGLCSVCDTFNVPSLREGFRIASCKCCTRRKNDRSQRPVLSYSIPIRFALLLNGYSGYGRALDLSGEYGGIRGT